MASGIIKNNVPFTPTGITASSLVDSYEIKQVGHLVEIFITYTPTADFFQNLLSGIPKPITETLSHAIYNSGLACDDWIKCYSNGSMACYSQPNEQHYQCQAFITYICE